MFQLRIGDQHQFLFFYFFYGVSHNALCAFCILNIVQFIFGYIIDVCAAPGGKSLHLADKLAGKGHVEARDLTPYKVELIRDNIARIGIDNIEAVCQDATVYDEASEKKADILIADLPCSGLGVFGKKTDLKYKMNPDTQEKLVHLQREILSVVHRYVKSGGKLLYSTCTIHRAENQENAAWFAEQYPEFELLRERQFLPGVDDSDGFYIAEFVRKKIQHSLKK